MPGQIRNDGAKPAEPAFDRSKEPEAQSKRPVGSLFPVNLDEPEVKVILTRTAVRLLHRSGNCRQAEQDPLV